MKNQRHMKPSDKGPGGVMILYPVVEYSMVKKQKRLSQLKTVHPTHSTYPRAHIHPPAAIPLNAPTTLHYLHPACMHTASVLFLSKFPLTSPQYSPYHSIHNWHNSLQLSIRPSPAPPYEVTCSEQASLLYWCIHFAFDSAAVVMLSEVIAGQPLGVR